FDAPDEKQNRLESPAEVQLEVRVVSVVGGIQISESLGFLQQHAVVEAEPLREIHLSVEARLTSYGGIPVRARVDVAPYVGVEIRPLGAFSEAQVHDVIGRRAGRDPV